MLNKPIIILALAVILFVVGAAAGWSFAKRASDRGVIAQQQSDAKEVMKHAESAKATEQKVQTIIRTRIKTIVDKSGCLDRPSSDEYLRSLLDADGTAKSGFN